LDLPEDLERLRATGLHHLIPSQASRTSGTRL
jgi:hypothetical protein